jgi:hypothetical protein
MPPSSGKMEMFLEIDNHLQDQRCHKSEYRIIQSVIRHMEEGEVQIHEFLTAAPQGCRRVAFTLRPGDKPPGNHSIGQWMCPWAGYKERKKFRPGCESNPGSRRRN